VPEQASVRASKRRRKRDRVGAGNEDARGKAAFALVGALAFGGMTERFGDPPKRIQLWGSFHFLSVGLAAGAAYLVGAFTPSALGWPLAAFAATATYLMVVGFEKAAADLERRRM
jgi:hypothetical protein